MRRYSRYAAATLVVMVSAALIPDASAAPKFSWRTSGMASAGTLAGRIAPPAGFSRVAVQPGSFGEWLRALPMRAEESPVRLYTGAEKPRQDVHAAVIDIDTGKRDLQQCADAIMRLRAEWLYGSGRARDIAFNDTDGKRRAFARYPKQDYAGFRKYMDLVFAYAGTYSLAKELKPRREADVEIGDVFIKGGFPGHAVLVVDMAVNAAGEKRFLLLQSYMPAQDMHVLKNPANADGSPWYGVPDGNLITPEWTFAKGSLKTWP